MQRVSTLISWSGVCRRQRRGQWPKGTRNRYEDPLRPWPCTVQGSFKKAAGNKEPFLTTYHGGKKTFKPPRPWRKIYKHVIYLTPTFANPSMKVVSLRRRKQLVRLARRYDALIVSDDVYDFLQWSSRPETVLPNSEKAFVPRVVDIDRYLDGGPIDEWGNTVSNGSFSKLIGPGVRTGWAEGTERFAYGLSQAYVFVFHPGLSSLSTSTRASND